MRALCVLILILCFGILLSCSKPLEDGSKYNEERKPLNITEIARMIRELRMLEILANQTLTQTDDQTRSNADPTAKESYPNRDPTTDEMSHNKDPTAEETYPHKDPTAGEMSHNEDPTADETISNNDPTAEETKNPPGVLSLDGNVSIVEEEDEEQDDATLDKPTEAIPMNFFNFPVQEPDFKPYPRFAILKNGYVHHMNLDL
ncbi:hypothetical protein KR009_007307 [Drosophila setifemur]|nr:hypothetical protein KR009_007307 [Drosophila setifemur]